jgi:ubiquinone/menaquinone biosynthesis C-methylase UbiE
MPFAQCFQEALAEVALRGNERVFETACGPATGSLILARRGHPVDAIDDSPLLLAALRARLAAAKPGSLNLRQMKPERLEFPDGTFDLGLSMFGLYRVNNLERSLRELARVLKAGSHLLLCSWAKPEESPLVEATQSALGAMFPGRRRAAAAVGQLADPRKLERNLLAAGFNQVSAHRASLRVDVADLESFWDKLSESDVRLFSVRVEVGETIWKAALPRAYRDLRARFGALPAAVNAEAWIMVARTPS